MHTGVNLIKLIVREKLYSDWQTSSKFRLLILIFFKFVQVRLEGGTHAQTIGSSGNACSIYLHPIRNTKPYLLICIKSL